MLPHQRQDKLQVPCFGLRKKIVLALFTVAWVTCNNFALACSLDEVAGKADELSVALQDRQVTRLEILHVPDTLFTRTRITPEVLRSISRTKVVVDDPWQSASFKRLILSLEEIKGAKRREAAEVRWAALFFDARGNEISAIYLSSDGSLGIFQGVSLSLSGQLLNWAKGFVRAAFLAGILDVRPAKLTS